MDASMRAKREVVYQIFPIFSIFIILLLRNGSSSKPIPPAFSPRNYSHASSRCRQRRSFLPCADSAPPISSGAKRLLRQSNPSYSKNRYPSYPMLLSNSRKIMRFSPHHAGHILLRYPYSPCGSNMRSQPRLRSQRSARARSLRPMCLL